MTLKYLRMNSIRLSQELFRHLSFIVVVFLPYEHSNMCLNGFLTQSCAIHVLVLKSHTRVAPYGETSLSTSGQRSGHQMTNGHSESTMVDSERYGGS